jgi:hypothetical protein
MIASQVLLGWFNSRPVQPGRTDHRAGPTSFFSFLIELEDKAGNCRVEQNCDFCGPFESQQNFFHSVTIDNHPINNEIMEWNVSIRRHKDTPAGSIDLPSQILGNAARAARA